MSTSGLLATSNPRLLGHGVTCMMFPRFWLLRPPRLRCCVLSRAMSNQTVLPLHRCCGLTSYGVLVSDLRSSDCVCCSCNKNSKCLILCQALFSNNYEIQWICMTWIDLSEWKAKIKCMPQTGGYCALDSWQTGGYCALDCLSSVQHREGCTHVVWIPCTAEGTYKWELYTWLANPFRTKRLKSLTKFSELSTIETWEKQ